MGLALGAGYRTQLPCPGPSRTQDRASLALTWRATAPAPPAPHDPSFPPHYLLISPHRLKSCPWPVCPPPGGSLCLVCAVCVLCVTDRQTATGRPRAGDIRGLGGE